MPRVRSNFNLLQGLQYRELHLVKNGYRLCLKILGKLVCDKGSTFIKIWESHSRQPITCEDGKLYFENYRTCMTLCGKNSLPSDLYRLPPCPKQKKIEDVIVYSGPLHKIPTTRKGHRSFFLALTGDNWLCCYDNFTGDILSEVYLGPPNRYKFRHVDWDTHGETIVVTSVQNQAAILGSQQGSRPRVLVAIAVFTVFPLGFIALLEIDREVFGNECNHINVSEGLLIVGTGSATTGSVRLYNFPQMLKEGIAFSAKLGETCLALDGAAVGTYPAGLPLNCVIKNAPPVLFEVKCSDYTLHIGGYPWHYVTTPPRREGTFQVKSLSTDCLVQDGCLDFPNSSTEPDSVAFHPDDSGRLVYNASHVIKFFRLCEIGGPCKVLQEAFQLNLEESVSSQAKAKTRTWLSPRTVNRKFPSSVVSMCEKSVLSDDYENELDLYAVLGFNPRDETCRGKIGIFDNDTGRKITTVDLKMTLDELSDYTLTMDLETFIILVRNECRRYSCYIYRLWRSQREEEEKHPPASSRRRKAKDKPKEAMKRR